jgi:hypothetical protein
MPSAKELAASLARLQKNDRVTQIRVSVPSESCPVCQSVRGTYPKDRVPVLPPEGCSCPGRRSRVYYEPVLAEIYP